MSMGTIALSAEPWKLSVGCRLCWTVILLRNMDHLGKTGTDTRKNVNSADDREDIIS